MILQPVIATFPTDLSRRGTLLEARRRGPLVREEAARIAGLPPHLELARNEKGAPIPVEGWYWSNSNTTGLACALVAPMPVGIDTEWTKRPRFEAARERFDRSDPGELDRLGGRGRPEVLRLWTAKEAVLKLTGIGIADLGRTSLIEVRDRETLRLELRGTRYDVHLSSWGEHLISVAWTAGEEIRIEPMGLTDEPTSEME
jgi:4'-phosphopantetheinyl transferase